MKKLALVGVATAAFIGVGSVAAFAQAGSEPEPAAPPPHESAGMTREHAEALLHLGEQHLLFYGVTPMQIATIKGVVNGVPPEAPQVPVALSSSAPLPCMAPGMAPALLALGEPALLYYGVTPEQVAVIKEAAAIESAIELEYMAAFVQQ